MPIPGLEIEARKVLSASNGKKNGTIVPTLWSERFAQRTQRMTSSVIRELLKLTALPDIISFAGGLPAPPTDATPGTARSRMSNWRLTRSPGSQRRLISRYWPGVTFTTAFPLTSTEVSSDQAGMRRSNRNTRS